MDLRLTVYGCRLVRVQHALRSLPQGGSTGDVTNAIPPEYRLDRDTVRNHLLVLLRLENVTREVGLDGWWWTVKTKEQS